MSRDHPQVSFVLATHNRQAVVLETLARISRCGLDRRDFEIILVDNASADGTPDAVEALGGILIRLDRNAGSCAKTVGADQARGQYVVFLDDDSYPRPGSVARMVEHFENDPKLAAAGFVVHLPDGRLEGGALPDVFVGCGVGLRAEALRAVGGLDMSFFMQAEEYDLSFRLASAGWRVRTFDDLHVNHLKTSSARRHDRTTFYDIRNNLRVVARHLPRPYYEAYWRDWLERYEWLAEHYGHERSYRRGVWAGRLRSLLERPRYRNHRLPPAALEHFFCWDSIEKRMNELAASGVRRIVFADLGKNVFTFYRAARAAGLTLITIGDDRFAVPGRLYRDVPVVPLDEAMRQRVDAIVIANCSAVHGTYTYQRVLDHLNAAQTPGAPSGHGVRVYNWFVAGGGPPRAEIESPGSQSRLTEAVNVHE